MNRLIRFLLFCAVFLWACNNKKKEVLIPPEVSPVENDLLVTEKDTIVKDSIEVLPPRSADELFNDFIFSFSNNPRFQLSRINFPLPVYENDRLVSDLVYKDWEYTHLHLDEEFYATLLDNEQQLSLEKDTTINHVSLEWLDLVSEKVRRYMFDRINGQWKMTALENMSLSHYPEAGFFRFYQHFVTDSLFQRNHVSDLIRFITYDEDEAYQKVDGVIDERWSMGTDEI